MTEILGTGAADAAFHIVLAHGAGARMTSPFLEQTSTLLAMRGMRVSRFEFAYMASRDAGQRKPPPRADKLIAEYRAVAELLAGQAPPEQRLLIGGKSMGGRVASMIADELHATGMIAGLVCLGYPFHPPSKPDQLRTAHLEVMQCPALIVQGERDPFGTREEVEAMTLSPALRFAWIGDGDHDFGPRGGSGFTRKGNLAAAADAVDVFARELASGVRGFGQARGQ